MFDNSIFDVVIGLVFVFFVFSLAVSGINELVRKILNTRAKALWEAISRILNETDAAPQPESVTASLPEPPQRTSSVATTLSADGATTTSASLATQLYDHPIIARLDPTRLNKPSRITHIPPSEFARALVDILTPHDPDGKPRWDGISDSIADLPPQLRSQLQLLYEEAEGNVRQFREAIESWFDSSMERVTQWYKKRTRLAMVLYGLLVAVVFNVSATAVTQELYENDVVRDTVVALAASDAAAINAIGECTNRTCVEDKISAVVDTGLPVWWRECPASSDRSDGAVCGFEDTGTTLVTITGWFITAAALSIGASFWFALLKRAFRLRSATRRPQA